MLPEAVEGLLREYLVRMRQIYKQDLAEGYGSGSFVEAAGRRKMLRTNLHDNLHLTGKVQIKLA